MVQVACGSFHTIALDSNGRVYPFGRWVSCCFVRFGALIQGRGEDGEDWRFFTFYLLSRPVDFGLFCRFRTGNLHQISNERAAYLFQ